MKLYSSTFEVGRLISGVFEYRLKQLEHSGHNIVWRVHKGFLVKTYFVRAERSAMVALCSFLDQYND